MSDNLTLKYKNFCIIYFANDWSEKDVSRFANNFSRFGNSSLTDMSPDWRMSKNATVYFVICCKKIDDQTKDSLNNHQYTYHQVYYVPLQSASR